jgi:hypothetical protein
MFIGDVSYYEYVPASMSPFLMPSRQGSEANTEVGPELARCSVRLSAAASEVRDRAAEFTLRAIRGSPTLAARNAPRPLQLRADDATSIPSRLVWEVRSEFRPRNATK